MKTSDDPTTALAEFACRGGGFPAQASDRAVDALTDGIGCMLAGAAEPIGVPLRAVIARRPIADAQTPAVVAGSGEFASPADAALANGAFAHALDYDDTNHPAYAHPTAVLGPALLALAPLARPDGRSLIDAYIVGFELFGKLGRAMNTAHYRRGWHATATFGTIAAVVAAGRLMELPVPTMRQAIGIAASAAGGLRANFGSMVKPLHAGYAARNGVLAVRLALAGLDAGDDVIGHRYGFLSVFNDGIDLDAAWLGRLGDPLEILTEHGLALKPYPSCGATHPAIEAALRVRNRIGDAPIARVRAGVCDMAFAPLIHVMPETPLQGKFSLHFCVAAALLGGKVDLATFTPERVGDPRIRDLIPRISMQVDPRWRDDSEFRTEIVVETADGRSVSADVPLAAGKPARWFDEPAIRAKFDDCLRLADPARRDRLYEQLRGLASAATLEPLSSALAAIRMPTSPARGPDRPAATA